MPPRSLSGGDALATAALCLALLLLLSPDLAAWGDLGIVLLQLLCFAAPVLLVAGTRAGGFAAIGLGRPRAGLLVASALIGATFWLWNLHWVAVLGEDWGSAAQNQALAKVFALPTRELWQSLVLFALLPALCEELLHRGLLLPSLAKAVGGPAALVLGALLFGLSHFNLARLLPTTTLGLGTGILRLRTGSLWPAIALHLFYNAGLITAARQSWSIPAAWALPAAVLTALGGTWIFWQTKKTAEQ